MVRTSADPNFFSSYTEQERIYAKDLIDYADVETLPEIWSLVAQRYPDIVAVCNPHAKPEVLFTYTQLYEKIQCFATGLQVLGVREGNRVALISDNSPSWLIADQGIMMAGAVNAVRSSLAEREELLFIISNSGSTALVLENLKTLKKLREGLHELPIEFVVLLSDEQPGSDDSLKVLTFSQLMEIGKQHHLQTVQRQRQDLATLIYTSGTTGKPKGVMLTHANLMHQVTSLGSIVRPKPGDIVLSILPTWHSYERSCEYFLFSQACTQIYTNLRSIKSDLKKFAPNYIIAVPRLLESIYEGIQKQFRDQPASKQRLVSNLLGISENYIKARRIAQGLDLENFQASALQRLLASLKATVLSPLHAVGDKLVYSKVREATGGKVKQMVSGGGALPRHIDLFFEIVGVEILVGYGLTETSPVTHVRRVWRNVRGAAGQPVPGTEIKIVDPETRKPLAVGERGLVLLRGPQIMQGYYQNPEATAKAIDSQGWFDSGDLGWVSEKNDLILTGRAKDTIVLTNGENIEPQPIEDACLRSPYIDQIMLVGQDQRCLGALIVPNVEALEKWAESQDLKLCIQEDNVTLTGSQKINLESKIVQDLFRQEMNREVQNRPGYRPDDRINPFRLIVEPFSIENGLMTQTLKLRRHVVMERYRDTINNMFA
ncbi:long-chain fatty acid--CoA ligase [Calothrix sp. UHCC 0171]|uniref:long-chain fatty acid--CoA ligase n=1 Tax=Calothrix sp. UHCC 0171 TaxID=3110245 RepID=UPI002B20D4D7|nr:long-chain fatty acid--CoA ligase [Calothrix sp. UHCC 0171]MEA5572841.1 long-chain fatty acid--CoA ligase [Calothrix sp. UHCC 0171]